MMYRNRKKARTEVAMLPVSSAATTGNNDRSYNDAADSTYMKLSVPDNDYANVQQLHMTGVPSISQAVDDHSYMSLARSQASARAGDTSGVYLFARYDRDSKA